jgi:hypothetical protein
MFCNTCALYYKHITIVLSDACIINLMINVVGASRIVIDDSRVLLQIVASLTDDSRGVIYYCNMFIEDATISQSL